MDDGTQTTEDEDSSNPLEFKVALIFAMLFVVFTILTHYTLLYAGTGGLNLLSFISGFSDITPFILHRSLTALSRQYGNGSRAAVQASHDATQ